MEKLAAVLVAAHAIADFFLQPDSLVKNKEQPFFLLLHAAIHAVLTYVLLQAWMCWQAPLFIFVAHAAIDFIKQRSGKDSAKAFTIDQIAHVLSLLAIACLLVRYAWLPTFSGIGYRPLIVAAGFTATVHGAGFLIGLFAKSLTANSEFQLKGLENGGKLIGQLERALIFLFIFIGQPAGIGFLVAAKSILRFEEAKQQRLAEYVLIGTLLSFSLAIALASATKWAVNL
jgi:hypothetical protein